MLAVRNDIEAGAPSSGRSRRRSRRRRSACSSTPAGRAPARPPGARHLDRGQARGSRGGPDGGAAARGSAAREAAHRAGQARRRSASAASCTPCTARPRPSATWRRWIWTMRGARAGRRHGQPHAPATGRVARGRRGGVQHHQSARPGSRPISRRPSSSTSRSASRSRSRRTPTRRPLARQGRQHQPGDRRRVRADPPQNATGNWVKVVQRLPVRIAVVRMTRSRRSAPA